jgi:lipid-A-disaccharide synthase
MNQEARRGLRVAMVAGEPSGDQLAAHLIVAIKARAPDAVFYGIGGPKMAGRGFDVWTPMDELSVFGYVDALKNYRRISGLRRALQSRLLADPPDVFIGVDAPDFNLDLERKLKARAIRTIHYVSPSIWAWRGGRLKKIVRSIDHLLCLFPFEPALYHGRNIGVTYVGHPMADTIPLEIDRAAVRERLLIAPSSKVVALLPGSRNSELERLAEPMLRTAVLIAEQQPGTQFLVPLATRETRIQFESALYRLGLNDMPIRLLFGHAQDALAAADVALVASGTATLEAALLKCPMVITYKVGGFQHWLLKKLAYLPYVGLPNVLAGRFLVPELLQDDATPEALATALLDLLRDTKRRAAMVEEFEQMHLSLRQDTAAKAASAVLRSVGRPLEAASEPALV